MRGDDRALCDVEASGVARQVGHDDGKDRAKDAGADAVEELHADEPGLVVGQRVKRAAKGQDQERGEEEAFVPPSVGARAHQHRHRHHDDLRSGDAGRHQAGAEILVLQRELLSNQRKHRRIREMKQHHAKRKEQKRAASQENAEA